MKRGLTIFVSGLAVLLLGLLLAHLMRPGHEPTNRVTTGEVQIGGPFELVDETGRTVTDETFRGKWMLVFFGFTYCPDVCPTTLLEIAASLEQLGDKGEQLQPLFITVDPERDTPDVVADYTAAFGDRILGLTGTTAQIEAVARAYRVYVNKVPQGDTYTVDHSAFVYLMGPDGKFVTHFSPQAGGEAMARKIAELLERGGR